RTPPKTQAALLEAMQERKVTIDGQTYPLGDRFMVVATQNPIEYEGTYPLPEAQLDRFLLRIAVGYPSADQEQEILRRRVERRSDSTQLRQVVDRTTLLALQAAVEDVHVDPAITAYIVDLVAATRARNDVQVGASPRGSLAVLAAARARAALRGRDFVVPEDVKAVAVAALGHRLSLRPELWVRGARGADVIRACLESVPTPPTQAGPAAG
ncbi:MAG TPA: ATPase, partial [Chloroflexi bacterium]|nr:ATPase [Chloroflexota bacterium]